MKHSYKYLCPKCKRAIYYDMPIKFCPFCGNPVTPSVSSVQIK